MKKYELLEHLNSPDISENYIRKNMPNILDILLLDRTRTTLKKNKNIIWANSNYIENGPKYYSPTNQITPNLITGARNEIIKPRALKSLEQQKERTRTKAEVFTPIWVVKKQNDCIDENYINDDLDTYISRTWLEITCGEAPYMVTRYEMETGKLIPLADRVGFLDRKLSRISYSKSVKTQKKWRELAIKAYQASYGFEWNGDSLLLARENLLYTMIDYYYARWQKEPPYEFIKQVAEVISYNVFQMDGLKFIIPFSDKKDTSSTKQLSFFVDTIPTKAVNSKEKAVKIMNWKTGKMELFTKGI